MLLVLLVLYSILPTLFGFLRVGYDLVERMFFYNRFIWLTIVYLIGAYLRNYYDYNKANELKINLKKLVLVAVMVPISIVMFYALNKKSGFGIELAYFWPPNTILMIILSVVVFKTFLSLKIKFIPAINFLASARLAVYLLHSVAFAGEMWSKIDSTKYLAGAYPLISVIVTAIIVYLVATVIETFRYKIDKMTVQKLLDSDFFTNRTQNLKKLSKKAETVFDKIFI